LAKDLRHTLEIAMTTRRSPLVCNLLAAVTAGCLALGATCAFAAAPKSKRPAPAKGAAVKPAEPAAPPKAEEPAPAGRPPAAEPTAPAPPAGPTAPEVVPPAVRAPTIRKHKDEPGDESQFAGGFFRIGLGYATDGGGVGRDLGATWEGADTDFDPEVAYRTRAGAGPAVAFQGGYNVLGYGSIAVELSGHGSPSSDKMKFAGGGAISTILGVHPLRFWRSDLPYDVCVYGGYTFFDILAYNENEFQSAAKGKSWMGSGIPFGLSGEYKFKASSSFALGLDLRFAHTSYDTWIYNWDKDIKADLSSSPVTTLRFEPKLMLNWHF